MRRCTAGAGLCEPCHGVKVMRLGMQARDERQVLGTSPARGAICRLASTAGAKDRRAGAPARAGLTMDVKQHPYRRHANIEGIFSKPSPGLWPSGKDSTATTGFWASSC